MIIKLTPGSAVEIRAITGISTGTSIAIRKMSKSDVKVVVSETLPSDFSDGSKLRNKSPAILDKGLGNCWLMAMDQSVTVEVSVAMDSDLKDPDAFQVGYGVNALYALTQSKGGTSEPLVGDFVKSARNTLNYNEHSYELIPVNRTQRLSIYSHLELLYNAGATNPIPIPTLPKTNLGSYMVANEWDLYYLTIDGEAYDVWRTTFTPYSLLHTPPVKVLTLPNSAGYQMRTLQVVKGTPGFWLWTSNTLYHFDGTNLNAKFTAPMDMYLHGPKYSSRPCHSFLNQNGGSEDSYGLVYLDAQGNGHVWTMAGTSYEQITGVSVFSGVTEANPDGNRFYIYRPNGYLYRAVPDADGVIGSTLETISTELPSSTSMDVAGITTGSGDNIWVHGYGVYKYTDGNEWIQPSMVKIGGQTVNNALNISTNGTDIYPYGGELYWYRVTGPGVGSLVPLTRLSSMQSSVVDYVQLASGHLIAYVSGVGICGYADWQASMALEPLPGAGIYDKVVARKIS